MERVAKGYAPPFGVFLVVLDDDRIVGTGAIRRLDESLCELKRMWLLPEYRGRGYGTLVADRLLDFARNVGYSRIRLDTAPELHRATRLYERLGFARIKRYNDGPCTIFMERPL